MALRDIPGKKFQEKIAKCHFLKPEYRVPPIDPTIKMPRIACNFRDNWKRDLKYCYVWELTETIFRVLSLLSDDSGESTRFREDEEFCHTSVTHSVNHAANFLTTERSKEKRQVFPVHYECTRIFEHVSRGLRDTMGLGPPCTDCRDCGRLSRACLHRTRAHLPFRTTRGMLGIRSHCHLSV